MSFRSYSTGAICALLPAIACAINVPALPAGMCALNERIPEQAMVVDYLRNANMGSNTVIASFAKCDELKSAGVVINHYGAVLSQNIGQKLPITRSDYVETAASLYSKRGEELTETALTDARQATASSTQGTDINNPKAIMADGQRVLFKNADMVIIGLKQSNNFGSVTNEVASASALTLLDGTPVSVNLYAPAFEANAFENSSKTLQPFVTQLIAANR